MPMSNAPRRVLVDGEGRHVPRWGWCHPPRTAHAGAGLGPRGARGAGAAGAAALPDYVAKQASKLVEHRQLLDRGSPYNAH
jgi:hypothetical protein